MYTDPFQLICMRYEKNPTFSSSLPASDGGIQQRRLFCDCCGERQDFNDGDDGFFYCVLCSTQSQDLIVTQAADEDVLADGGLYNLHLTRSKPKNPNPNPRPNAPISREALARVLSGNDNRQDEAEEEEEKKKKINNHWFDDEVSEPRDFGSVSVPCPEGEVLAEGIRLRYVKGLQLMLERQWETLVEKFGVSPLIVGIMPQIWLKYVAATRVFADDWAESVIKESEEGEMEQPRKLKYRSKYRSKPHNLSGKRAIYVWFRALRRTVPLYSTLSISYLVCHIARAPILPTDIFRWALEGKLPYLVAYDDMDKLHWSPSDACPFSLKRLFRPIGVPGADQLEATAASIAQTIGLRLPSVNFYAIAHRYLKELRLPVDKILPHACRLYMWSIPPDLWLSSSYGLPSRVCVMSILIVTIRILYNINGQGTWEMNQCDVENSSSYNHRPQLNPDSTSTSATRMNAHGNGNAEEHCDASNSKPAMIFSSFPTDTYKAKEVLDILEATYDTISMAFDYLKDLLSYLKYCKDIVFAGSTPSYEEERIIERLWEMYEKKENDRSEEADTKFFNVKVEAQTDATSKNSSLDPVEESSKGGFVNDSSSLKEPPTVPNCSAATRNFAVEKMKLDMEDNGFQYLCPRVKQTDGYLHYKRKKIDGEFVYVTHADYYILLRSCSRIAQIDAQRMHQGVLKLEKRLDWLERQIDRGLGSLSGLSFCENDNV